MILSKLAKTSIILSQSTLKTSSYGTIYRNLASQARDTLARKSLRTRLGQRVATGETTGLETPINVGRMALAGASVFGLGSLAYYGLGFSKQTGFIDRASLWPQYVKERIQTTYQYFGAGLGVTAASAMAVARSPTLMNLAMKNSIGAMILSMGLLIGSGMVVRSIPYESGRFGAKQIAWAAHAGILGALLAPMTMLGGPLLIRAAWYTAGIIGGLSVVAATAPSEKFLNMAGPLSVGLGLVFASSIGGMFFPPTTKLGLSLYSISIYGGLILFSLFLLYDTQKIVHHAENAPHFDPINQSISIYLDAVNIFIRMATILAHGGNKRR
ncbi:unnamed protein product [Brachionus calyciflorus]|uniref:Growth hormone-inducible transmembrane protein n=1 Tax=Brachionus calyciflorus TaxID=104777 RepID=A0A813SZN8_9BILA|nr:unnamed protein product [Brachionus calyciflorus]